MSFLNAVINRVEDDGLREYLQERVEIVQHKIKFMDRVPVAVLNTKNEVTADLKWLIEAAGADFRTIRSMPGWLFIMRTGPLCWS
jgi:hypothetical protein